jgi:hypothetical protein
MISMLSEISKKTIRNLLTPLAKMIDMFRAMYGLFTEDRVGTVLEDIYKDKVTAKKMGDTAFSGVTGAMLRKSIEAGLQSSNETAVKGAMVALIARLATVGESAAGMWTKRKQRVNKGTDRLTREFIAENRGKTGSAQRAVAGFGRNEKVAKLYDSNTKAVEKLTLKLEELLRDNKNDQAKNIQELKDNPLVTGATNTAKGIVTTARERVKSNIKSGDSEVKKIEKKATDPRSQRQKDRDKGREMAEWEDANAETKAANEAKAEADRETQKRIAEGLEELLTPLDRMRKAYEDAPKNLDSRITLKELGITTEKVDFSTAPGNVYNND